MGEGERASESVSTLLVDKAPGTVTMALISCPMASAAAWASDSGGDGILEEALKGVQTGDEKKGG